MMMLSSLRLTTSRQCVRFLNTGRTTPNKPGFLEPGRNAHESKMREIQYKVTKVVLGNDGSGGGYGRAYLENDHSSGVHEVAVPPNAARNSMEPQVRWIPKESKAFKEMHTMEKEWIVRKEIAHDLYDFIKEGDTITLCRQFVECKIVSDGLSKTVGTGVLDHLIGYKILSDGVSSGLMDLRDCADKNDVYSPDPVLEG